MKLNKLETYEVIVVDDIMGSGKTTWAIQFINNAPIEQKFIFVTPYLDEGKRIIKETRHTRRFYEPNEKNLKGTKMHSFKELLKRQENIVTTHALFSGWDSEVYELLKLNKDHYTLVMDEVAEVVEKVEVKQKDIKLLLNAEAIEVVEDQNVRWVDEDYDGKFNKLKQSILSGKVSLVNGTSFIKTFPSEMFTVFRQTFILTYMFEAQIQRYYFEMHVIPYTLMSVEIKDEPHHVRMTFSNGEITHRVIPKYELIDYRKPDVSNLKELINILDDEKLNAIGKSKNKHGHDNLTFRKLEELTKSSEMAKKIHNNLVNVFRHKFGATADEVMWTSAKILSEKKVIGKGYMNSFVPSNARATNQYHNKSSCAYLVNKFMNPSIVGFFRSKGIEVNQDDYALSEMVQWLWRSRIRKNEPIKLYIPSQRMRGLLLDWMDN